MLAAGLRLLLAAVVILSMKFLLVGTSEATTSISCGELFEGHRQALHPELLKRGCRFRALGSRYSRDWGKASEMWQGSRRGQNLSVLYLKF